MLEPDLFPLTLTLSNLVLSFLAYDCKKGQLPNSDLPAVLQGYTGDSLSVTCKIGYSQKGIYANRNFQVRCHLTKWVYDTDISTEAVCVGELSALAF